MKRLLLFALLYIPAAHAQFEVASIKRCEPDERGGGDKLPSNGRFNTGCVTVQRLIQTAYGIFASGMSLDAALIRVVGAPSWVGSETYRIDAKSERAASIVEMAGPMTRALLEDRFRLKIHTENRQLPVYALTIANGGPKLQPTKEGSCTPLDLEHPPERPAPGSAVPRYCGGNTTHGGADGLMTMEAYGQTMAVFAARILTQRLDRPVIDRTGLTGMFDFKLELTRDQMFSGGAMILNGQVVSPSAFSADDPAPSLFTALREQLGLKLVPETGPVQVLVVDHVERPTEN